MRCSFTLDFWIDDGWFVGKLREVPNVFSQGESLEALKANIQDAYRLMVEAAPSLPLPRSAPPKCRLRLVEAARV